MHGHAGHGPGAGPSLVDVAAACDGLSGRTLRKLPFLAHARAGTSLPVPCPMSTFLAAMLTAAAQELQDRSTLAATHC